MTVPTTFGPADPPDVVRALLDRVAIDVPVAGTEPRASTSMTGPKTYATTIAIRGPADADDIAATFLRWTWYASRRAGLHLDDAGDTFTSPERVEEALGRIAASLHLNDDDVRIAAAKMHMERWAAGERLQREGEIPQALRFVMSGRVLLDIRSPRGDLVPTGELAPGQILGLAGLIRQQILAGAMAMGELEGLVAPVDLVEELMRSNPALARDMGRAIDIRVRSQVAAMSDLLQGRDPTPEVSSMALFRPF